MTAPLNTSNTLNLKDVYNFLDLMDFLQASLRVLNPPNCPSPGQRLVLTPVYDLCLFCIFIVTANERTNVMPGKDTLRLFFFFHAVICSVASHFAMFLIGGRFYRLSSR